MFGPKVYAIFRQCAMHIKKNVGIFSVSVISLKNRFF